MSTFSREISPKVRSGPGLRGREKCVNPRARTLQRPLKGPQRAQVSTYEVASCFGDSFAFCPCGAPGSVALWGGGTGRAAGTAEGTAAGDGCHGEKSASFAMGGQNRGRGRWQAGLAPPTSQPGQACRADREKMGARTRVEVGLLDSC